MNRPNVLTGSQQADFAKVKRLRLLMLQIAILTLTSACGGGGYGDDDAPPPAAPPAQVNAQFIDDTIEGLGFSVPQVVEGKTDATGTFKVAQGRRVDFFVGEGANRIVIGSANPTVNGNGAVGFSLNDLNEVQGERTATRCSATWSACSPRSMRTATSPMASRSMPPRTRLSPRPSTGQDAELQPGRRAVRGGPGGHRDPHRAQAQSDRREGDPRAVHPAVPPVPLQQHRAHER